MTALPRCMRSLFGNRFVALLVVLTMIAGALPARAQSPVAYPPIKLIHLYEHTCPAGVDPRAGGLIDAANACPQSFSNVNFTLTSQDQSFAPQTHPTDTLGATEWHEVPSGFPYAIQQVVVPAGYGNPVVRCQMGQNLQTGTNYLEITLDAPGGRIDIGSADLSLTYFMDNSCYWFDIPAGQTNPGIDAAPEAEVAVDDGGVPTSTPTSTRPPRPITDTLPEGQVAEVSADTTESTPTPTPALSTSLGSEAASPEAQAALPSGGTRLDIRAWQCPFHFDAAAASVDQLLASCTSPHRDANFIINGDPASQQPTGSIGATSYQSVPFGTVTIQQLAYGSYDPVRVFCYTQPFTAPHGPLQASQEIGFTKEAGDTFSVTIKVNPGDAIDCIWFDAQVTEDDSGSLLIHKYVCPDGTTTAGLDLDLMLHACPEPQVAYFQLVTGYGSSGNETDSNGYIGFINHTPSTYYIREIGPFGYATARVFCRSYNADDWNHIVDPWVEQTIDGKVGFTIELQAHWETECAWFNVKGVNYGFLDINARSCPLAFTPTATTPRDTFAQQCQTGISGAMFDIDSYPNYEAVVTSTDGYALFQQPVTVGYLSISSTDPQTYSFVRAFCGDAPFIGIGAIPTKWTSYAFGFIQYNVPSNYQVVCEFYYRPIAIAAGAEAEAEASPDAVTSASDEEASATTGDEESAAPEASPEAVPSEESTGGTGGQGSQSGSTGGNQSSSGGAPDASQPPADANAPATLTLVAFTCPPGYDLYADDAVPSGDCPDPAIGIDFTVTGQDDTAQQATSNAGGELAWMDIAPGAYLLQAALPPETERAFIADCVSDQRTFPADNPLSPFANAGPEGQIGITLLPGETLACTWYDVPAGQGGVVTGLLFSCPGTTVIKAQCTPSPGPATLQFEPAPGTSAAAFELQIGDDGSGSSPADEGAYLLTGLPTTACLIESDAIDASSQLVVLEGDQIEIRIYTCGG